MTGPATEFASVLAAQAQQICALIANVDAGDGQPFGDRVSWEPAAAATSVPPSVVVVLPGWAYAGYASTWPQELSWELYVLARADDQTVARLWQQAHAIAVALEAATTVSGVVDGVDTGVWRPSQTVQIPAYVVRFRAVL